MKLKELKDYKIAHEAFETLAELESFFRYLSWDNKEHDELQELHGHIKSALEAWVRLSKKIGISLDDKGEEEIRVNRYNFEALREKALRTGSREDIEALGEWLLKYDSAAWNGEFWDIGDGHELRPVYSQEPNENDGYDIIGYEIF